MNSSATDCLGRFLLAGDPGADRTIMAGLLIKELLVRGDVHRCLIVCPGMLVEQWQGELDRLSLPRLRARAGRAELLRFVVQSFLISPVTPAMKLALSSQPAMICIQR